MKRDGIGSPPTPDRKWLWMNPHWDQNMPEPRIWKIQDPDFLPIPDSVSSISALFDHFVLFPRLTFNVKTQEELSKH